MNSKYSDRQYQGQRRDDDMSDYEQENRHAVGNDLFNYNRRFSSDYANFDSAHAADYQRHSDSSDEYRNIREGYYQHRGLQTGNALPARDPDAYGNRYGRDGEHGNSRYVNDTRYRPESSVNQQRGSGYHRNDSDLAGYGSGSVYNQGDAAFGDTGRYETGAVSNHRGKGPKSYVRSDERIREDISDRLRDDDHIDASDIEVTVSGAEVVLSGLVDSRFAKRHAEDLAESISGVRNVENRIRVRTS